MPAPDARVPSAALAGAAVVVAALAAACGRPHPRPPVDPPEGISIAVYDALEEGFAVIDDRRTIEVTGRRVLLDRIDPGAALPTLVIEPLGASRGALAIEQCARERLRPDPTEAPRPALVPAPKPADADAAEPAPDLQAEGVASPLVACTVTGAPGRHRVRVHYVARPYRFEARHEIAMTAPDRATISTRFTLPTPAWGARAEVVLHDGAPGGGEPPREVGRGSVALDGGTAVLAVPPREVPARVVRVYDGMTRHAGIEKTDLAWGRDSQHDVGVMLLLEDPRLLRATAHVRISLGGGDTYEIGTFAGSDWAESSETAGQRALRAQLEEGVMGRSRAARPVPTPQAPSPAVRAAPPAPAEGPRRLLLGLDPLLRGTRKRSLDRATGASLADRVELTVSNTGGEPREVWIEEPLRPAKRREIARAHPIKPETVGDVARARIVVGPGKIERLGFTVRYTF